MRTPEFNELLNEYMSVGVGQIIYDLIMDVVSSFVRFYPPAVYSPNGVWDEDAISSVCNDFITDKLLQNSWLDSYFLSFDSVLGIKKALRRDFRYYLINQKARTEKSNLYTRIKLLLRHNPLFSSIGSSSYNISIWGLASWKEVEIAQEPFEIIHIVAKIQLPPLIRYRPDSTKISPLINNRDLLKLIETTFLNLEKRIPVGLLFDVICLRLGVLSDDVILLDEPIGKETDLTLADVIPSSRTNIEPQLLASQVADDIYDQLSDRQRQIIGFRFTNSTATLENISEHTGISKSTVSNELTKIGNVIKANLTEACDSDQVITSLKQIANKYQ